MEKVSVIIPTTKITPSNYVLQDALKGLDYEVIIQGDPEHKGKGWALQEGFKKTKGDRIVWLDADLQINPRQIRKLLRVKEDVIVGSKLHPRSILDYTMIRRLVTCLSSLICRSLFCLPVRDTQTGLKIFSRRVLNKKWYINGYGHDIEVLLYAYHNGYTIVEMPVEIEASSVSTVTLLGCVRTLYEMLWLKWGLMRRKR